MWVRGVIGIVLCIAGVVWIAQGIGSLHGSFMTGHRQYAVLGAGAIVAGLAMFAWAHRRRSQGADS